MATVIVYNNDVQGALRALKKEQQKDGVFRIAKGRKNFKDRREKKKERLTEIIRRKIKDKHENRANSVYSGVKVQTPKPFVFELEGYMVKVYDDGKVKVYTSKNKKINELMLNEANFDDIKKIVGKEIEKTVKKKKKTTL